MKIYSYLIFFILLVISFSVSAEYRAYQYYVKSKYNYPHKTQAYLVTSSLSPKTYISYHGGNNAISVDLVRTWICKGNTAKQEVCEGPSAKVFIQ